MPGCATRSHCQTQRDQHHTTNKVKKMLQTQFSIQSVQMVCVCVQVETRKATAYKKILDTYYIFKPDSELKKHIQEKLPEKYSSVFTLRNLITDIEKIIHKKIPSDETIIIRDWNLEMVTLDGKNLEEPVLKPSIICFHNRTSRNHSYCDFKAKQVRLESIVQRLPFP